MGLGMAASCLLSDGIWYLEFRNLGIKKHGWVMVQKGVGSASI